MVFQHVETRFSYFICDPVSHYVTRLGVENKSAKETIAKLSKWKNEMVRKGFLLTLNIQSNAGSNFTSEEFSEWFNKEQIKPLLRHNIMNRMVLWKELIALHHK